MSRLGVERLRSVDEILTLRGEVERLNTELRQREIELRELREMIVVTRRIIFDQHQEIQKLRRALSHS